MPTADTVTPQMVANNWHYLPTFQPDPRHLSNQRVVSATRDHEAHTAFDVLRTRLLQALAENGWRRVAITSPNKGCGKTFAAANLAISLSRQEACRTVLLDLDLRRPTLNRVMGVTAPGPIADLLSGAVEPTEHLVRVGDNPLHIGQNLAFGFNNKAESYASELLLDKRTGQSLDEIEALLDPDVMLFDLPPALNSDDVISMQPYFDGVVLVLGGGITKPQDVKEVERRLGDRTPLLGMVLNQAEAIDPSNYGL